MNEKISFTVENDNKYLIYEVSNEGINEQMVVLSEAGNVEYLVDGYFTLVEKITGEYNITDYLPIMESISEEPGRDEVFHLLKIVVSELIEMKVNFICESDVLLKKEYIYLDKENNIIRFLGSPRIQDNSNSITNLIEDILETTVWKKDEVKSYLNDIAMIINKQGASLVDILNGLEKILEKPVEHFEIKGKVAPVVEKTVWETEPEMDVKPELATAKETSAESLTSVAKVVEPVVSIATVVLETAPEVPPVEPTAPEVPPVAPIAPAAPTVPPAAPEVPPTAPIAPAVPPAAPEVPPAAPTAPVAPVPPVAPAMPVAPVVAEAPVASVAQNTYQQDYYEDSIGETTVLSAIGETTVLGVGMQNTVIPILVRIKNGEKAYINKPVYFIGKDPARVDYCIFDNSAVSRVHAKIETRNGEFYIIDNFSTNHVYLNGVLLNPNTPVVLTHGARVRLGDEEFEFKFQ